MPESPKIEESFQGLECFAASFGIIKNVWQRVLKTISFYVNYSPTCRCSISAKESYLENLYSQLTSTLQAGNLCCPVYTARMSRPVMRWIDGVPVIDCEWGHLLLLLAICD